MWPRIVALVAIGVTGFWAGCEPAGQNEATPTSSGGLEATATPVPPGPMQTPGPSSTPVATAAVSLAVVYTGQEVRDYLLPQTAARIAADVEPPPPQGTTLLYVWSTTGLHGQLAVPNGNELASQVETSSSEIVYNPVQVQAASGQDTVNVEVFSVLAGGERRSMGAGEMTLRIEPGLRLEASTTGRSVSSTSSASPYPQIDCEPYGDVSLTAWLEPPVEGDIHYEWTASPGDITPSWEIGEIWDADGPRRIWLEDQDLIGSTALFRASTMGTVPPHRIIAVAHRIVGDERLFLGSASVLIQVGQQRGGAVSRQIEFPEELTGSCGDWKFYIRAEFSWPDTNNPFGHRVEIHTPGQEAFLDWFYKGNPPTHAPETVIYGDNLYYGPIDGILVRDVPAPYRVLRVASGQYIWDGCDPPPESWLSANRQAFRGEQYGQWTARVTEVPAWTAEPYFDPDNP